MRTLVELIIFELENLNFCNIRNIYKFVMEIFKQLGRYLKQIVKY